MSWIPQRLLVSSLVLLSACASLRKNPVDQPVEGVLPQVIQEKEASSEDVEQNIQRPYRSGFGEIALDQNKHVQKWIDYFQGRGRRHMDLYLARSTRYLPMMKNVLRENDLPEDLVYIALIESGFSPRAHSHANAVGYWQFIRGTGKRFGLHIDTFIDERRDPVLATRAAAQYFRALYEMLGSWHLAMAAYNVGEMRVKRAVRRYGTKDFWQLISKRRSFPRETKNYVPKFIAAAMIAKDPAKYGFTQISYQDPLSYDAVTLQSPISLSKLAANLSVDLEEMKLLNPKFRTDFVPISRGSETVVRIPVGRGTDALAALSMSVSSQPKIIQADHYYYRIRRGDNLSTIARRHRTTVSRLRRLNGLSNRSLLRIGRKLKVPDNGGDRVQYASDEDDGRGPSAVRAVDTRGLNYHVVRSGENLTVISRRYGVGINEIRRLNNLGNRSILRKGQKLRIRADSPRSTRYKRTRTYASVRKSERVAGSQRPTRRHVVRRGETMWDLSKKYGVPLNRLARANKVRINYRVMAGERIRIPD